MDYLPLSLTIAPFSQCICHFAFASPSGAQPTGRCTGWRKNDKSDLRNLNIVYFHFFPRVTALPVSSESAVCPSASQPLSALNAVLASHSSDAIYRKVKITEESPAKVVCNYVSGFFSSALIKGETEPIICHSHIISEIRLP